VVDVFIEIGKIIAPLKAEPGKKPVDGIKN